MPFATATRTRYALGFGREHELQEVIAGIEARLAEIKRTKTREYDDKLAVIEADAAPYALAFVYEIRRLEHLLARQQITARLGKMRRRNRQRHATVTSGEHEA
jgi:hypothetical protein